MKLSNSINYFFEISKKKRVSSPKDVSNVIVFEDLERYTSVHIEPERPLRLATTLWQKLLKKKMDFLSLPGWKMCGDALRWGLGQVSAAQGHMLQLVSNLVLGGDKGDGEELVDANGSLEAQTQQRQLKVINHVGRFEAFLDRKFMFLNKSLLGTKLSIPPFSSLNIPNMIFVDFNSKRYNQKGFSHFFNFLYIGLDYDYIEPEKLDYRNMDHNQIDTFLDQMVLVVKNDLTQLSIIPIK